MTDCLLHRSSIVVGIKATWILRDASGPVHNA